MSDKTGTFYAVGVGPGDPDLLTLKAVKVLKSVDLVAAPRSREDRASLAHQIAAPHIPEHTRVVYLTFPMQNQGRELEKKWRQNQQQIIDYLNQGLNIAFITLGDPMLYSTYLYLHTRLKQENFPLVIIPGITAVCDSAAKCGLPLAIGRESLQIVSATLPEQELKNKIAAQSNLVLMKVQKYFSTIYDCLKQLNRDKDAALICRTSLPGEKIYTDLSLVEPDRLDYFSTLIIREKNDQKNELTLSATDRLSSH